MASVFQSKIPAGTRARLIASTGWLIILFSAGAALLPFADRIRGGLVLGVLLLAAGLVETFAGVLRKGSHGLPAVAGAVTTLAGLLFLIMPKLHILPTIYIIAGWLLLRSLILIVASRLARDSVRMWIGLSAATDFVLALLLIAGLSIATVVVSLFGPIPAVIASFAWILALSFIVTGTLLLEVASCEREAAGN